MLSKFVLPVLALSALVTHSAAVMDEGVHLGEAFGGPHGTKYSDVDLIGPGQTVKAITIRAGERINGVGIDFTDATKLMTTLYHGGPKGKPRVLTLGEGEYITAMEAHWGEKGDHTRIKYIQFATNKGNHISGGNPTKDKGRDTAPEGYQLGGFAGTCGRELDSVAAVWTRIEPVGTSGGSKPEGELL
ncbi:hypothetical protein AM587_10000001 [Phytophthora nicotianae]|uniref:Jacalin-type lectin domain-containing protein n=2 Tax=Phytophthora nicotianae TaxID=4792 RepID=A0A0W8C3W9_PHYNI|nr:hypothetical protein AM587_10000001 [Phytophthora nicotianae]